MKPLAPASAPIPIDAIAPDNNELAIEPALFIKRYRNTRIANFVNKLAFIASKESIGNFIILDHFVSCINTAKFKITIKTKISIACEKSPFKAFKAISFVLFNTPNGINI